MSGTSTWTSLHLASGGNLVAITVSTVSGFSVRCEAIFIWSRLHSNTHFFYRCMMLHEKWCWHGSITYNYNIWYRIVLLEFESSERPEGSLEEFPFIFFLSTKTRDQRFKRCFQRQRHWCLRNLVGGTSYPISRKCQMFCLKIPFRSPLIIRKTHHVFHVFQCISYITFTWIICLVFLWLSIESTMVGDSLAHS